MQINLAPAVQALAPLALAALTAAVPYGLVLARRALGMKLTSQQQTSLIAAVDAGAQAAYGFLVANRASVLDLPMRNVAIAAGADHALASVAPALKALNITPEHVRAMVDARLGGLLAADPTVSVAGERDVAEQLGSPPRAIMPRTTPATAGAKGPPPLPAPLAPNGVSATKGDVSEST